MVGWELVKNNAESCCVSVMDQLAVMIKRPSLNGVMVTLFVNGKRRYRVLSSHPSVYLKDVLRRLKKCKQGAVRHRIAVLLNTLRTGDAHLRFYITTVQDG